MVGAGADDIDGCACATTGGDENTGDGEETDLGNWVGGGEITGGVEGVLGESTLVKDESHGISAVG